MNFDVNKLAGELETIVYVREVDTDDLPEDIREQVEGAKKVYAVHSSEGERLALVGDRNLAFALARQNELSPVPVH
ncbi:MAG: DUF1150 family protein [Maritimibacter harenae]|jgi:hypothetical protein|uniref:DUF1150 family protein n=1 Tax=Maritimibacter harenae TaxID=2606218 RepID=A0A845M5H5_9RHOB|nr:DUF1150 family protein [Maritimibacter harenae]MZR14462.1 DUF1150 family protein [Maritimibacter harenae]